MKNTTPSASTLLETIRQSLAQEGRYNTGDSVAPAAILWTDADAEWMPIVQQLRNLMPELLMLGQYDPEQKMGPAIWLRCAIEGVLPDVKLPKKVVPVLYLPNISRQTLRSPEDCPDLLKPLVELQYRGTVWTQVNGKDWTVEAFLVSENGGLGLEMARDNKTRQAMLGALDTLSTTPVAFLRGHKLEAEDFDKLMIGDTIRDMLGWISDPAGSREAWDAARWAAFCSRCREEYDFDPESEGDIVAAERLGLRQDKWANVWRRFTESPSLYPGVPAALRRAKPAVLIFDREPWPDENEKDEASLRGELIALAKLTSAEARDAIVKLDEKHGERRSWVWARMGLSPLAAALGHLRRLAECTASQIAGDSPDAMADTYIKGGYHADDAVLLALASVKSADDQEAIREAIRCIYLSWLEDTARNFQTAAQRYPLPDLSELHDRAVSAGPNECILFVDGLRYDIAQHLLDRAHECSIMTTTNYRWAALPPVTSTAKSAVTPVATAISAGQAGADFYPIIADLQKPVSADQIRELLTGSGYQVLHGLDAGQSGAEDARAWTECGEFDALGHKLQARLASQIDEQLDLLLNRIVRLLETGWRSVRVVTDHGWLLVPGGLPSIPLKKYLAECRWARCAVIKEGARADVPTTGWFWDKQQQIAFAPGVYCFVTGAEYAHGGLSLQECLIPDLTFSNPAHGKQVAAAIEDVQWLGLRCRVAIKPPAKGLFAGLRSKPNDPKSSICQSKPFDNEGRAGLLVEDEGLMGMATSLVIFDSQGRIISRRPTIVGGDT